ncbi:hypothetical protein WY13_02280 [Clostridium ljungdahlii]|uniref:Uncharacterized protein n=1 Tax=Clostridium ljungdahlii TaxID=1538 RepID=A0A162L0P2_9CLOT|nr:hypothetical protein WY13_02280 [Clostridium ljungdahlii]
MKNNKNLLFYMLGRFMSYIGTGIQQVAIPLYILDITHSGIMMGIFLTSSFSKIFWRTRLEIICNFGHCNIFNRVI